MRTFAVMVASATTGSLIFNFTTNGNAQLMAERFDGLISDPAILGSAALPASGRRGPETVRL